MYMYIYIYKCILLEFATIMPALNIVLFVLLPSYISAKIDSDIAI